MGRDADRRDDPEACIPPSRVHVHPASAMAPALAPASTAPRACARRSPPRPPSRIERRDDVGVAARHVDQVARRGVRRGPGRLRCRHRRPARPRRRTGSRPLPRAAGTPRRHGGRQLRTVACRRGRDDGDADQASPRRGGSRSGSPQERLVTRQELAAAVERDDPVTGRARARSAGRPSGGVTFFIGGRVPAAVRHRRAMRPTRSGAATNGAR